jgi:hypothetical protein
VVRVNVLLMTVAREKTNAEKHYSRHVKMNALFLQNVRDRLLVGAEPCPRKEFSCIPPYKCQDSHNSDVLPIRQSIIRNIRAECLFRMCVNDIHTPFRHFELASTRLTSRQPTLPRQVPAKLSKHPRTQGLSAFRRSPWWSSVRQTHLNTPAITDLWRGQSSDALSGVTYDSIPVRLPWLRSERRRPRDWKC